MLGQQHQLGFGMLADRVGNQLGEGEARPDVGDPDRVITETLLGQSLTVDGANDRADRIGVGVVDVRRRREGVQ